MLVNKSAHHAKQFLYSFLTESSVTIHPTISESVQIASTVAPGTEAFCLLVDIASLRYSILKIS